MNSILQCKKECYVCKIASNLEAHHLFFGQANRKLSEKYGLKVLLCYEHHRGTNGVHGKNGRQLDLRLKKIAQRKFEETHTREDFVKIFGKSYL